MTGLGDLTWPEVADRAAAGALLAVPLGSVEQHGPHLPLSTDADLAETLCRALAIARPDVLVAPTLAYGASGEHAGFAGTLSMGTEALETVLVQLGRSASDTFARLLFVSAHGGNAAAVHQAVQQLRAESRDVRSWFPHWRGDAHAGRTETSLQLALQEWRVRAEAPAGATDPLAELMPALRAGGVRSVSANGILGDPAGASADEGRQILSELVDDLLETLTAWVGPAEDR